MNEDRDQSTEGQLIGVKSLAKKRGWIIDELNKDKEKLINLSSKFIFASGGSDAIKKYRIELGIGDRAYQLTTTKPYTNKKGKTHLAQFIGNTYCGRGQKNKYVLAYCNITKENFDENWTVDKESGLLKAIPKYIL